MPSVIWTSQSMIYSGSTVSISPFIEDTFKGLKIHTGKAHKTASLQTPEKERSSFNVEEPTLTLTPLNVSSRKGEIDTVEPE